MIGRVSSSPRSLLPKDLWLAEAIVVDLSVEIMARGGMSQIGVPWTVLDS
jgi:hypothetical protein